MSSSLSSLQTREPFSVALAVKEVQNEDGAVLLDIRQGLCFSLTPVAAHIWRLLKLHRSVEDITKSMCVEFDAPREQIEEDVANFLGSLRQHKLLLDRDHDERRQGALFRSVWRRLPRLHTKI